MNKKPDHSADAGTNGAMAVLIDGDNAQPTLIDAMLAEAARYGTTSVRRIYGDFTSPQMGGWARAINEFAFHPQQQFAYTTGKNATDSAMIIDAMDLLHSGRLRGFCIVSSDSDFTRLATRIREQGVFVMGIGAPHTPKSFVNACEIFVRTTNLVGDTADDAAPPDGQSAVEDDAATPDEQSAVEEDWQRMVVNAVSAAAGEDGWAFLANVGDLLRKLDPAFDPRTFGHKQLSALVRSKPHIFRLRESKNELGSSVIDVRVLE